MMAGFKFELMCILKQFTHVRMERVGTDFKISHGYGVRRDYSTLL